MTKANCIEGPSGLSTKLRLPEGWHPPMVLHEDGTTDYPHAAIGVTASLPEVGRVASYVAPTGAVRDSANKVDYSLIPLDVLEGTARVFKMGEKKYGRNNWRKGFPPVQTLGSVFRHLSALQKAIEIDDLDGSKGVLLDAESGENHVHHLICSVLIAADSLKKAGFKV